MTRHVTRLSFAFFGVIVLGVSLTGRGSGDDSDLRIRIPTKLDRPAAWCR
jgi:hypothetical protein